MKRKFLALLLCLALCLPFVLASCTVPNLWQPQKEKEKTFFDEISCMWDKKEYYDSASSFTPSGNAVSSNDKFVYSVGMEYSDESAGILADKTIYRVYNIASGAIVFEDFTAFDIKALSYTSEHKAISVMLLDKMVLVKKVSAESGEETSYFLDENGNELLKTTDSALTVIDEDRIILNRKLYVLENGKLEMKKDLRNAPLLETMLKDLKFTGDKYVYMDAGNTVYVFDKSYNFLYEKALRQTQGATFAEEQYRYFSLANGNIIFQTTYSVGSYSTELEPYTYDYISNGKCYRLDSLLLDINSGNYREIELPYILTTALPVEGSGANISLPYGAQNIGVGQRIDGKKLVSTGGAAYASFLLYNDGATRGLPTVDGSADLTVIGENRFIIGNEFGVKLYDENAKLIGTLGYVKEYNEKLIVTGTEILNHKLELVYSLTDNNAAVDFLTADSAIVTAFDSETRTSTRYLITSDGEPKVISSEYELIVRDSFYVTVERKDGTSTLVVYKTNGEAISEFSIEEGASIDYYDYDGYSILETKNLEGKTMYINVFKTEKV